MANLSLAIENNLSKVGNRLFKFKALNESVWKEIPPQSSIPTETLNPNGMNFIIDGKRIHDSSIAVSLKGFTHALELVDKSSTSENFMLLRFVPKKIGDDNTPDIKVECLTTRLYPDYEDGPFHYLNMQLSKYHYIRNTILNKKSSQGDLFEAKYSFSYQDMPFCIGDLKSDETLEIHLEEPRPNKKPDFFIYSKDAILKKALRFIDHNDDSNPHIELIIENFPGGPETINITVNGDEI